MDPLADLLSLQMERSLDGVYFTQLAQVPIPGDLSIINIFSDTTALTNQLSYYYRLVAMDSCSNADTSTIGKSILLLGYAFTNLSFLVQWDESYFENGTVDMYRLYRDDGTGFVNLGAFDPDQFQYTESGLSTPEPCYYIEASDSLVFANGTIDTITSRSNVLCLTLPSQIYMPNAFAPEGKNNIFLPILNVNGISSYDFSIFNRWGQEIFATSDPSRGWDGTFLGNLVPQGAYVYQVLVVDGNKKHIEAKGSVLVVR
jgi:gliding motility-associated-like protein